MDTLEIQKRLDELGFSPGPLDGIRGRLTIGATKAFQRSIGLTVDGIVGPITRAALFPKDAPKEVSNTETVSMEIPWMAIALRKKGLHEERDYTELKTFLRKDGSTVGDPRKIAWCGDFWETCMALSLPDEPMPVNPYLARNALKEFGRPCEPRYGATAVYWRTHKTKSIFGHIAYLVGEGVEKGRPVFYNLGGNQSNAITVAPLAKDRLLGCRWPITAPLGKSFLPRMKGGKLSTNEA